MNIYKEIITGIMAPDKPTQKVTESKTFAFHYALESNLPPIDLELPKKKAEEFGLNEDGTYSFEDASPVEFSTGYQVSFERPEHPQEVLLQGYHDLLAASSDGQAHLGFWGNAPEFSFNIATLDEAMALAKKYNQMGIWDWENMEFIENPDFIEVL